MQLTRTVHGSIDMPGPKILQSRDRQCQAKNIQQRSALYEALEALMGLANQSCHAEADGSVSTNCLHAEADALRLLSTHGLFIIEREYGRAVRGRFDWGKLTEYGRPHAQA